MLGSKTGTILENHIILISKRYIYSCKLNSLLPSYSHLLAKIRHIRNLEKYIAKKNCKLDKFNKKCLFLSENDEHSVQ